jgi:hypothetical protein
VLELPVIGCGLDGAALATQLGRYRALAADVATAERRPAELDVAFAPTVDRELLTQTVAVERGCCGFFRIELTGSRLRISVAERRDEPALAVIADALGVVAGSPSASCSPRRYQFVRGERIDGDRPVRLPA